MTYKTEAEIKAIVDGFESCGTDKAAFKHLDHLTVAVFYLQELDIDAATVRLREALLRFVDHHKVDRRKYNQTITVFWLELVNEELKKLPSSTTLVEKCNKVIESLNESGLALQYYSTELLFSDKARETFVRPDLKDWRTLTR